MNIMTQISWRSSETAICQVSELYKSRVLNNWALELSDEASRKPKFLLSDAPTSGHAKMSNSCALTKLRERKKIGLYFLARFFIAG